MVVNNCYIFVKINVMGGVHIHTIKCYSCMASLLWTLLWTQFANKFIILKCCTFFTTDRLFTLASAAWDECLPYTNLSRGQSPQ